MKHSVKVFLLAFSVSLTLQARAPEGAGRPEGRIDILVRRLAAHEATHTVQQKSSAEIVKQVVTDAEGRFQIEGLPPGAYVLTFKTRPAPAERSNLNSSKSNRTDRMASDENGVKIELSGVAAARSEGKPLEVVPGEGSTPPADGNARGGRPRHDASQQAIANIRRTKAQELTGGVDVEIEVSRGATVKGKMWLPANF